MKTIVIECSNLKSISEFWDRYVREVQPQGAEHFGRNLDAFNDALAGGPGFPGKCELVFRNSEALDSLQTGFLKILKDIVAKSSAWNEVVVVFA